MPEPEIARPRMGRGTGGFQWGRSVRSRIILCSAVLSIAAAVSVAEEKKTPPELPPVLKPNLVDPANAQNAMKKAAGQPGPPADSKPSTNPTENKYAADSGILLLLDECVEISIQNNLNLKLSRLNDRESDYAVRIAWSQFFPTFNESILHSNSAGVGRRGPSADGSVSIQSGVTQQSPWGTKLDFVFDETRSNLNNATRSVTTNISQPLWKGAGTDANLTQLRTARIGRLIARGNLELDTQGLIFQVRQAYASVIQQVQQREVLRDSIKSAQKFLEFTEAREKAGNETLLDVSEAKLQLRTRELDLIVNERTLETAYDQLKQIMDVDLEEKILVGVNSVDFGDIPPEEMPDEEKTIDVLESDDAKGIVYLITRKATNNRTIGEAIGTPKIVFQAQHFDESKVLNEAMNNRIDLLNNRRSLAVQQLQTMLAKNGLGYQVDLVGSYGHNYTSKELRPLNSTSDANNWTVGVNASIPWGKIADRASYETALLELQKSEITLKRVRTTVHADVRDIMRTLREAERTVLIQALRVEQAKLTVKATFVSFKNGLKDSFQVVSVKNDLVLAKNDFITATLNYVVDLARLEVVVGKATGRVDLEARALGGEIEAHLPDSLSHKQMPKSAPDADPSCEDHALNNSRVYRCDPKPEPDRRLLLVPQRKPDCKCEIIDSKP